MIVKYIRVSTLDQKIDRQLGDYKQYVDKCSGSIPFNKRPSAMKLLANELITEVHVHSIDRLGRNTIDILQTIKYFTDRNINVISEKEGLRTMIDGKINPVASLLTGILSTLAEFELARIKERQMEGILKAKERGAYMGRKFGTTEDDEVFMNKSKSVLIARHINNGESVRRTALLSKCSINTVRKVVKIIDTSINC